ncbi:MAG: sigma-70 family RNA polymerase sigma factor [Candidatus Nanopelagicales bacterium]
MPDDATVVSDPVDTGRGDDARARFERLFDAYAVPVHRYLARRHAGDDTEDLVADVFVVAWRRLDEVPTEAELPWLYRTAWHLLANHRRRAGAVPVAEVPEPDPDVDVADRVIDDLALAHAWGTLGGRDREVLRLAAWEGLDGRGLAAALGLSVGGAAAALSRARARLVAAWAESAAVAPELSAPPVAGGGASPGAVATQNG